MNCRTGFAGAVRASLRCSLCALALLGFGLEAQTRNPKDTLDMGAIFERRDYMIPMRDGARLYTEVYIPRNAREPLPMLMERTPYDARAGLTGFRPTETGYSTRLHDHTELVREGYIFVLQDIRGRFRSTGEYQTLRPPRDKNQRSSTDESTDTYDTIAFLIRNVPDNNGRVGVLGISYGGFTTMRAMLEMHPALKATSPQATCADMFVGDDWIITAPSGWTTASAGWPAWNGGRIAASGSSGGPIRTTGSSSWDRSPPSMRST